MRQSQAGRRATRSFAIVAAIVGSTLAGLQAGEVSAGAMAGIVLSTDTVAPGQAFDALFNCQPGAPIEYSFQGASSTINCGGSGIARAPLQAPDELGEFEVSASSSGVALSATLVVVAPGEPTLVLSGAFSPNLPVGFMITECARGSQPVGEFNGEQTTAECQVGQNGQTEAFFAYLGPSEPGIYPVTATLDANTVLDGAIYVAGEASTPDPGPDPGLAETGPAGSTGMQLVAAAAAVGLGTSFVIWARRRRTTISAR